MQSDVRWLIHWLAIRVRDPQTILSTGDYILCFESQEAAASYLENAFQQHRQARGVILGPFTIPKELPTSFGLDPIKITPFTLAPPHSTLNLRPLKPVPSELRSCVEEGGYAYLKQQRQSNFEVLVWADSASLTLDGFAHALSTDGHVRNEPWPVLKGDKGLRELCIDRDQGALIDKAVSSAFSDEHTAQRLRIWRRFVVAFANSDDAHRFALNWHRRDISKLLPEEMLGEEPAIINAELIW